MTHMLNTYQSRIMFLLIIGSLLLLAGCGKSIGDTNVYLGGKVIEKDDQIIIVGRTNLLEGSRVTGTVLVNGNEVFSDTTELVDNKGHFNMELEHHQYGDAEVVITFDFYHSMQEEQILERYGEAGELMEGPYVYLAQHWDLERVYQKAEVRLPLLAQDEESEHEFNEPDWGEPPEDIGDPRVWIEVDEITEDGEFFYVKGRTNFLEGSALTGFYSDSWAREDETRVNPDGTFELKIEYTYSEEPYFTLRFSPYNNQWETIREAYGRDGEKLVGNLVERSNSYQFIESIIEYEQD
ncbi:hypothetical protein [Bacillus sp. JCM 19034]|uniref:hypothetical protein n=1 Tax=Bacillus sp. JCM 19034 TaxID=1481928 RepID=UPI0007813836|nr:hypothetical protein [Bacillus sp. JCM 19034]